MSRPARYNPHKSPRRRRWIFAAVIAFVMVDVLLISWALGARSVDAATEPSRPIPTFTPGPPTADPTPSPVTASTVALPSTRLLSALDDTTAWRATTGACPAGANPELTTDAGESWLSTDATNDVEITTLQSLNVVSDTLIELVGLSADDCTPQFAKSFVAGDDYSSYPEQLDGRWYVDPADRSVVHTPIGEAAAPCAAVVALAPRLDVAGSAAVLCADTQVFTTANSAETWSEPFQIPGSVNLAVTAVGYVVATVGLPECAGVQLMVLSVESSTVTSTGCLLVDASVETMPGNVAVAEASGTLWLWVGNDVKRSLDGGMAWR
ncbi:hypothetical protein [Cryobacterium sp. W22_MBD10_FK3]|uniref:hypothetical protein n=1 Tax=Cryobacterium sp. W22_MBD10_FK3 TaxID=3240273 RepID=UPI003F8DBDF9